MLEPPEGTAQSNLTAVFLNIIALTRQLTPADDASIVLWDPDQQQFVAGHATNAVGLSMPGRVRRQGGASRWIVEHGQPLVVADTQQDPFSPNAMIPENGIAAYVGYPLQDGLQICGVLYALHHRTHSPTNNELLILELLAKLAGQAIRYARQAGELELVNHQQRERLRLVAHDLRHPLGLIQGALELLLDDLQPLPPFQERWQKTIESAQAHMMTLLNQLQEETPEPQFAAEKVPCELNTLVYSALSTVASLLADKRVQVSFDAAPAALLLAGNAGLLQRTIEQMLASLVSDARPGHEIFLATTAARRQIILSVVPVGPVLDRLRLEEVASWHDGRLTWRPASAEGAQLELSFPRLWLGPKGNPIAGVA